MDQWLQLKFLTAKNVGSNPETNRFFKIFLAIVFSAALLGYSFFSLLMFLVSAFILL